MRNQLPSVTGRPRYQKLRGTWNRDRGPRLCLTSPPPRDRALLAVRKSARLRTARWQSAHLSTPRGGARRALSNPERAAGHRA